MSKIRIEAQVLYEQPYFDVPYEETTLVDMDELVQAIGEELFPGAIDTSFPVKVEQKIISWFMQNLYPHLKQHEQQPPNPNGYLGSDALGVYKVTEKVRGALNDLVEEFLYRLADAEYDYTDFRGEDL